MTLRNAIKSWTARRAHLAWCTVALAAALAAATPIGARADNVTPPSVPDRLVPTGNRAFLVGHATGTQNYICLPSATSPTGFAFALFTPEATLFSDDEKQLITHFFSPNPGENGAIRATWQHSRDSSTVWARVLQQATDKTDPTFVQAGAVPWLLLEVPKNSTRPGPTGGDTFVPTSFVQRVNTSGGSAPTSGCSQPSDVGTRAFQAYTADYFFYEPID